VSRILLPPIIIDTREQLPYEFSGYKTKRAALETGDYVLEGFPECAVERKGKTDAWGCVGGSRRRFEDCLQRLAELERPAIVIECSLDDFATPPSRTRLTAAQAVGSYISWSAQYRIPVFFCTNRAYAERVTLRFLAAFYKHMVLEGDNRLAAASR
jgi:DNA excision repair protein ERCC-4